MRTEQQMADDIKAKADALNEAISIIQADHSIKVEIEVTVTRQMRDKFDRPHVRVTVLKPLAAT